MEFIKWLVVLKQPSLDIGEMEFSMNILDVLSELYFVIGLFGVVCVRAIWMATNLLVNGI